MAKVETYKIINGKKETFGQRTERVKKEREEADQREQKALDERLSRQQRENEAGAERAREKQSARYKELEATTQGYDPATRAAMQKTAYTNINRQYQDYRRRLGAQQGVKGIYGGTAYAQNRDLLRLSGEQSAQYDRDLAEMDNELKRRKIAAQFAVEQGAMADYYANINAINQIRSAEEQKKREKAYEERFDALMRRI